MRKLSGTTVLENSRHVMLGCRNVTLFRPVVAAFEPCGGVTRLAAWYLRA